MPVGNSGGTLLVFGIDSPLQTYGIVQQYTATDTVETAIWSDSGGKLGAVQQYGQRVDAVIMYFELSELPSGAPDIGTKFTYAGNDWIIEEIQSVRSLDGFKSITVNAFTYFNIQSA